MYWRLTEWHDCGINYRAVYLPWWQVEEILGHVYDGEREDLERVKAAVLEAGAPRWVQQVVYDGVEADGMYLIGGPLVYSMVLNQEHHLWELEAQWGTVEHEGSTWYLTQQPYIAGTDERPWYEAIAINLYGDAALIKWTVTDEWEDIEDESDVCQWDKPAGVTTL
jgi:hypothetical protein